VLVAVDGGLGKGSGRSISAFDLHGGLTQCSDLLIRYGGHRAAAGITIDAAQLEAFAERFNTVARARLTPDDLVPVVRVDIEVPLGSATADLEAILRHFEPFGAGNATPVLVARNVRLAAPPRVMGQGHLRLRLTSDGHELDAVGWGMAPLAPELASATQFDVAYRLERDEWNGQMRLQARVADLRF
jgi:single-stranded-DNA-specific exonuclease